MSINLPRELIDILARGNPRIRAAVEKIIANSNTVEATLIPNVEATDALDQATVLVLSPNAAFRNEFLLKLGPGLRGDVVTGEFTLSATGPTLSGGFSCNIQTLGNTTVVFPLTGRLATTGNTETLKNKTLEAPALSSLGNYANDAAAAGGGVAVGSVYRNGSVVMVRVV
ncbi:MAG: hypothetical protein V4696_07470 [Pseudomonadota bacterium]